MYICVDFDGTLADHQFPQIGWEVPNAVKWCKTITKNGGSIILWTMRCDNYLEDAIQWCKDRDIELFGANENPTQISWTKSPKAYGHMYIDDAAVGCPLIQPEGFRSVCVDWEKVGPLVMNQLYPVRN